MASSHHEHRQDKTVLSCLVGGVKWTEFATVADSIQFIGDRTVLSCLWCECICELVLTQFPNDVTIGNHVSCELETESRQDKTQFTPHFETGQNCFEIFSCRQTVLSCHQFSQTPTRQDSLVLSVFAMWHVIYVFVVLSLNTDQLVCHVVRFLYNSLNTDQFVTWLDFCIILLTMTSLSRG